MFISVGCINFFIGWPQLHFNWLEIQHRVIQRSTSYFCEQEWRQHITYIIKGLFYKKDRKEACTIHNKGLASTIGYINLWSGNIKGHHFEMILNVSHSVITRKTDRQLTLGLNKVFTLNLPYKMIPTSAETVSVDLHQTNLQSGKWNVSWFQNRSIRTFASISWNML